MPPYPYKRAVADELRTLRYVYRLSIDALDDDYPGLRLPRREWEQWDHADQFILESINEQLNRIVDGSVFFAFHRLRAGLRLKETRLHRNVILNMFEEHFGTDVTALPGWQAVLDVAHDANATKHRAGMHWVKSENEMAAFAGTVQMQRWALNRRIMEVGKWLRAFGAAHNVR